MDKQTLPPLNQDRWTISTKDIESRIGGVLDSAIFFSSAGAPQAAIAAARALTARTPISAVMKRNLSTVDAGDSVEKIQQVLSEHEFAPMPVVGSNGTIVGIIGAQEIAHFLSQKKNPNAVSGWEISRCTMFEVKPSATVEAVARLMADNKLDYFAVTERGALQGVVSALDLVQVNLPASRDKLGAA